MLTRPYPCALISLSATQFSDCVYHFCEGHDATQHAAFGEAAHIAVTLRMHEESSYEGLDLVECEVRRRTFWLLFGGMSPTCRVTAQAWNG